jgi:mannitol/fructose-specific phosphotransferase system IIA component
MIQQFQKNQFIHYIEQLSAKNDTAPIATTNLSNNGLNRKYYLSTIKERE